MLKKSIGSVQFQFYKFETEKTELNQTQIEKNGTNRAKPAKPSQTRKKLSQNQVKPTKQSQTGKTEPN